MTKSNKKRLAVIIPGWHYSIKFYDAIMAQTTPKGWEIDYFIVGHRMPDDTETISEKDPVRNYNGNNFLQLMDKDMYHIPVTLDHLTSTGWQFSLEENCSGDAVFNQWRARYSGEYDMYFTSDDDNYILSTELFADVLENKIDLYRLDLETLNEKKDVSNAVLDTSRSSWLYLENGWNHNRIYPRMSFAFYTKEIIDMLGGNTEFLFEGLMTRKGEKSTPTTHMESNEWNTPPGRFLNFFQDNNILDGLAYLTNTKRVSKYCIEGERGYVSYAKAGGQERYLPHLTAQLKASGIITPGNKS
mgnify:CR=1 FL=1